MFLVEFIRRSVFGHSVVILGFVLDTAGFVILLRYASASLNKVLPWYLALAATALAIGGYLTWREERIRRADMEQRVRIEATLGSFSANVPDPGPDKASISAHVFWEIWNTKNVSTDSLALNIVYLYPRHWWQVWKRTRFEKEGVAGKRNGTTQYRRALYADDLQKPFKDNDVFEYTGPREEKGDPHWLLELVLWTGTPRTRYAVPLMLPTPEELHSRGTNPPL